VFLMGEACEYGEIAVQFGSQDTPLWRQDNAVDKTAHNLGSFGHRVRRIERLGEAINFAAIELGQLSMEPQHRCWLAGAKPYFRLRLFLLERGEPGLEGRALPAILNGAHDRS